MLKRIFTIVISMAVVAGSMSLAAFAQTGSYSPEASKARARVETWGKNTRVEVKLRDTTKVKGYITANTPDSFTVSDNKTGVTNTVAYADVVEVKKASSGASTKTWLIVGGVAAAAVVTWLIVKPAFCDGGAQTRGIC
ncbi:MAG TPA: hypothetical protein VJT50_13595 [Pyrinomonadaceae bacterium]|nr:hypothetical protein [Pyrinomonadaceae bacterium]